MDILKSGDVPALVTNIEVLNILSSSISQRKKAEEEETELNGHPPPKDPSLRHRDFIEHGVYDYIKASSCAGVCRKIRRVPRLVKKLKAPQKSLSNDGGMKVEEGGDNRISEEKLDTEITTEDKQGVDNTEDDNYGYGLTDAETLQILNHLPVTEPVEIHLMIEDLPSRMNEDRQTELLDCLKKFVEDEVEDNDVMNEEEEGQKEVGEEEEWHDEVGEEEYYG